MNLIIELNPHINLYDFFIFNKKYYLYYIDYDYIKNNFLILSVLFR